MLCHCFQHLNASSHRDRVSKRRRHVAIVAVLVLYFFYCLNANECRVIFQQKYIIMTVSKHFREGPRESSSILLRVESLGEKGWGRREDNFRISVDVGWQNISVVRNTKNFYNLQKDLKEQHKIIHCLPHEWLMKLFGIQRKLVTLSNFLTKIILSSDLRTHQVSDFFSPTCTNVDTSFSGNKELFTNNHVIYYIFAASLVKMLVTAWISHFYRQLVILFHGFPILSENINLLK